MLTKMENKTLFSKGHTHSFRDMVFRSQVLDKSFRVLGLSYRGS